jgi:hypothetical protein
MQIAMSREASEAVNPISSPFAIEDLDRSHSIVGSVDIYASCPNCSVALSLIYHKRAMTINRYVEAGQPPLGKTGAASLPELSDIPEESAGRAKASRAWRRPAQRSRE